MAKDYYKILGVGKDASKEDIKKAYKRLAKKYHPDLNKEDGSAEKFKEINEAAALLGDDQKRQQYDQFGTADFAGFQGGAGGFDFSDFMRGTEGFGFDFDSIFDSFFGGGGTFFGGGGRRQRGARRGSDLVYEIDITLEEAADGAEKHITLPKMGRCDECNGKGAKFSSDVAACDECNGTGTARHTRRTPFGIFSTVTTCGKCHGEGTVIRNPCRQCHGTGVVEATKRIKVEIPAGVDSGTRLRVSGEGEAGQKGGPAGDLFVSINVINHKIFERHGNDIHIEMPVSFSTACLGGEIQVPTLSGKAKMKIPSGTQSNTVFRLKGEGIPSLRGYGKGDEKVTVIVDVPKKLTKRQREILEEFEEEDKKSGRSIFDRIKESF